MSCCGPCCYSIPCKSYRLSSSCSCPLPCCPQPCPKCPPVPKCCCGCCGCGGCNSGCCGCGCSCDRCGCQDKVCRPCCAKCYSGYRNCCTCAPQSSKQIPSRYIMPFSRPKSLHKPGCPRVHAFLCKPCISVFNRPCKVLQI